MNRKKLTALITALSCILCLTACAGNNAGSNSSSDETNGSAIQISNKEESKTEEPAPEPGKTEETAPEPSKTEEPAPEPSKTEESAPEPSKTEEPSPEPSKTEEPSPEPSKTEEPAKDDRITGKVVGKDVFLMDIMPEFVTDYVYLTEEQCEKNDELYEYGRQYAEKHSEDHLAEYYKKVKYNYQSHVINGEAKPNMKKLQLDEIKEILNTYIGRDCDLKERFYETKVKSYGRVFVEKNEDFINTASNIITATIEKQQIPDATYMNSVDFDIWFYWPDADTLQERREEIVVPMRGMSKPFLYRTFDENGDLIEETVLFDFYNDIRNF